MRPLKWCDRSNDAIAWMMSEASSIQSRFNVCSLVVYKRSAYQLRVRSRRARPHSAERGMQLCNLIARPTSEVQLLGRLYSVGLRSDISVRASRVFSLEHLWLREYIVQVHIGGVCQKASSYELKPEQCRVVYQALAPKPPWELKNKWLTLGVEISTLW